ncbi:hypothetical protein BDQ12DRAFT_759586 [Crucibulum laeve]|uniref:Uncharacterized protein n=1 Tax=Crucibulum laeve TaxID=68775 RepID=A0A5C3LTJ9_9AGAR|nr:hypothetical protein BDQ12DRAFT_759586 [Crucibulum laeve]
MELFKSSNNFTIHGATFTNVSGDQYHYLDGEFDEETRANSDVYFNSAAEKFQSDNHTSEVTTRSHNSKFTRDQSKNVSDHTDYGTNNRVSQRTKIFQLVINRAVGDTSSHGDQSLDDNTSRIIRAGLKHTFQNDPDDVRGSGSGEDDENEEIKMLQMNERVKAQLDGGGKQLGALLREGDIALKSNNPYRRFMERDAFQLSRGPFLPGPSTFPNLITLPGTPAEPGTYIGVPEASSSTAIGSQLSFPDHDLLLPPHAPRHIPRNSSGPSSVPADPPLTISNAAVEDLRENIAVAKLKSVDSRHYPSEQMESGQTSPHHSMANTLTWEGNDALVHPAPLDTSETLLGFCKEYEIKENDSERLKNMRIVPGHSRVETLARKEWQDQGGFSQLDWTNFVQKHRMFICSQRHKGIHESVSQNVSVVELSTAPDILHSIDVSLADFCYAYEIIPEDEERLRKLGYTPGDRRVEVLQRAEWQVFGGFSELGWRDFREKHARFLQNVRRDNTVKLVQRIRAFIGTLKGFR